MNYLTNHAMREFRAAGWLDTNNKFLDPMQEMMCIQVCKLLDLFCTHGHSGFSAPYAIDMFKTLARHDPLVPLTGADDEWHEVSSGIFQNIRCGYIFKENEQAYNSQGIVFWEWNTDSKTKRKFKTHFTSKDSRVSIKFPYMPKTVYRQRVKEKK